MYFDDRFNPAFDPDINELDEQEKRREEKRSLRAEDKHFVRHKKEMIKTRLVRKGEDRESGNPGVLVEEEYTSYINIDLYGSGDFGKHIRSAVNGIMTPHLVGTKDEDLYFVVSESRGLNGKQDTVTLYFDSPEQYEKHCYVTVPAAIKERWYKRFTAANDNKQ